MTSIEVIENAKEKPSIMATEAPTPHGMLLEAFAKLKKEKEAIAALTDLQRKEKQKLEQDLEATKAALVNEGMKVQELEAKLQLKAASAECQIHEVESFSKDALADALEKNAKLSEQIADKEFLILEEKREKEYLLKRTATLARRDQLQKASILTMTQEIEALTTKVNEFGDHFTLLATRSAEMVEVNTERKKLEKESAAWMDEKKTMAAQIAELQASLNQTKDAEAIMKDQFVKTLTTHKENWAHEKQKLNEEIQELISEKDCIEVQVSEIAELLEKDHIQRHGLPFVEDPEKDAVLEPPGTKRMMMYNQ